MRDGPEDEFGEKRHHVARGEVFAGFLVVLLVEPPDQLLEQRPHRVVVQGGQPDSAVGIKNRGRGEVDAVVQELLNQAAQNVGIHKGLDLVTELELVQDLLDVWGEAVQVRLEVGLSCLDLGTRLEVAERVGRRVKNAWPDA